MQNLTEEETKPPISSTLIKLQEYIENNKIKLQIELSITTQQEIILTINKLKEHFEILQILRPYGTSLFRAVFANAGTLNLKTARSALSSAGTGGGRE